MCAGQFPILLNVTSLKRNEMQAEHFIYATFNHYGIRIIQSSKVDLLLTEESLQYLFELGKHATEHAEVINDFRGEQVVAYSYLNPEQDELGRRTVWNHTILIRYEDIIPYDKLFQSYQKTVQPHYIKQMEKPPHKLEPLKIGE